MCDEKFRPNIPPNRQNGSLPFLKYAGKIQVYHALQSNMYLKMLDFCHAGETCILPLSMFRMKPPHSENSTPLPHAKMLPSSLNFKILFLF